MKRKAPKRKKYYTRFRAIRDMVEFQKYITKRYRKFCRKTGVPHVISIDIAKPDADQMVMRELNM